MNQGAALAAIAVGGGIGSVLRFLVANWFVQRFGPSYPWGTFIINVSGAFLIGIVLQLAATRVGFSPYLRLFCATGILGGYTTFSTFAFETYALTDAGLAVQGMLYACSSIISGVIASYLGVILVRTLS